jgi:hypothetical protein
MFSRKLGVFAVVAVCGCVMQAVGATLEANLRMRSDEEKVLNRANLTVVKEFIIKGGVRATYSNMYNNNPALQGERWTFYLNPDTGQQNINCEIGKSDFQILVIRGSEAKYCHIDFRDANNIVISVPHPADDLTVGQMRKFAEDGVKELLAAAKKEAPATKPAAGGQGKETSPAR